MSLLLVSEGSNADRVGRSQVAELWLEMPLPHFTVREDP